MTKPHDPLTVCSFESRRAADMETLIARHGARGTVAPSMQELPLEDNPAALEFAADLLSGKIDVVIFMTGVGARTLLDVVETRYSREEFFAALQKATMIVRGPKPTAVLHEWKVRADLKAPEPNTWRELLAVIDENLELSDKTVVVQEYGESNDEFYAALRHRGAVLRPVPVYRWAFPDDVAPLHEAIHRAVAGDFDVLMFTSAHQLANVLEAAEQISLREQWMDAARKCVIASIGPTASEFIASQGLKVDIEASPPKMGPLVRTVVSEAPTLLAARSSSGTE